MELGLSVVLWFAGKEQYYLIINTGKAMAAEHSLIDMTKILNAIPNDNNPNNTPNIN